MTSAIFVHPDDLAAIKAAAGPAPIGAPQIVSNPYLERGTIIGPVSIPSFENLYNALPPPTLDFAVDPPTIKWPIVPRLSQYFARIETGPRFVKESRIMSVARLALSLVYPKRRWCSHWGSRRAEVAKWLPVLLDPNYRHPKARNLPRIIVIVDELADMDKRP